MSTNFETPLSQIDTVNETDEHSDLTTESNLQLVATPSLDEIGQLLADAMSQSPFVRHTATTFSYHNGEFSARLTPNANLIGNTNFNILHGGVAATILDTIGGLVGMFEIYKRHQGTFDEQTKKVKRLATVDLRIDYLAPGRGEYFIATAEVIRIGRKGCTSRMMLVNHEGKAIAHGLASYAF